MDWWSWLPLFDFDVQKSAGAGGVTCSVYPDDFVLSSLA
jgi:hypothetical protein